jgi:HEAT repeat protein
MLFLSLLWFSPCHGQTEPSRVQARVDSLISVLEDSTVLLWLRESAIMGLGEMGPAAEAAVEPLVAVLRDSTETDWSRLIAAEALGKMGPAAEAAVKPLIAVLRDTTVSALTRGSAVRALGEMRPAAEVAVKPLIAVLQDTSTNVTIREAAAELLGEMGPAAEAAVKPLIAVLRDSTEVLSLHWSAVEGLGEIGPAAVGPLNAVLQDSTETDWSRRIAAEALGEIGQEAVGPLIAVLRNPTASYLLHRNVTWVLGNMDPAAIGPLIAVLQDTTPDEGAHIATVEALVEIKQEAVGPLTAVLRDTTVSGTTLGVVARALGKMGPAAEAAVKPLIVVLQDSTMSDRTREAAARALGKMGPAAEAAVEPLVAVLRDSTETDWSRGIAAEALGKMGPAAEAAVKPLIAVLRDTTVSGNTRGVVAEALGKMGPAAEAAVKPLIAVLRDTTVSGNTRGVVAEALGKMGPAAEAAVEPLIAVLRDTTVSTYYRRRPAADGLTLIAEALHNERRVLSGTLLSKMERANDLMRKKGFRNTSRLQSAIVGLKNTRRLSWRLWITEKVQRHPYVAGIGAFYVLLLGVWGALLGIRPLWLLRINDRLEIVEGTLSLEVATLQVKLPLRHLLLSGFFHYHPRVLDAWVAHYLPKAREEFRNLDTVREREIHIPLPVERDDRLLERLDSSDLQDVFARTNARVLIQGEGGSGKTSLACYLAQSAMKTDPEQRLCKSHRLLPVLVETEFTDFVEAVRARLRYLIEAERPPPDDLVKKLLRKRRVLVIVDHLSEMSPSTREAFRPGATGFAANALIVTSRVSEPLGRIRKTVLRPLRVEGNRVSEFVSAYLRRRGKRDLFPDSVFFDMLSRFSRMVGNRPIPVLFPRIYAGEMIAAREKGSDDLPANIPDMVLRYLNQINPHDLHDNQTVHRVAKRTAWLCLKEDYRPSEARLADVREVLGEEDRRVVSYLEERMRILQTVKPQEDRVRFTLDPVAEYLAALYKTGQLGGDARAWRRFLSNVDDAQGEPEATRGFVRAMHDCCLHPDFRETVPDWGLNKLDKLGDLDA